MIKRAKEMKTLKVRMSQVLLPTGEIEYLMSNMEKEIISETNYIKSQPIIE